jgi:hypothetical protein
VLKKERNQGYFQDLDLSNQDEWWPFLEMGNLWGGTLFFFTALIIDWHIWFFFFLFISPTRIYIPGGNGFSIFYLLLCFGNFNKRAPGI